MQKCQFCLDSFTLLSLFSARSKIRRTINTSHDVHAIFLYFCHTILSLRNRPRVYSLIVHKEPKTLCNECKWDFRASEAEKMISDLISVCFSHKASHEFRNIAHASYGLLLWCIQIMHFILLYIMHHIDYCYDAFMDSFFVIFVTMNRCRKHFLCVPFKKNNLCICNDTRVNKWQLSSAF